MLTSHHQWMEAQCITLFTECSTIYLTRQEQHCRVTTACPPKYRGGLPIRIRMYIRDYLAPFAASRSCIPGSSLSICDANVPQLVNSDHYLCLIHPTLGELQFKRSSHVNFFCCNPNNRLGYVLMTGGGR